jgi:type IX secretion system PorP/SprF family membrane protein
MTQNVLLLVFLLGCTFVAKGQYGAQFSQYNMALGYYNPATAGRTGDLDIVGLYRIQWAGWSNAPKTMFANASMPFRFMKKEHGVGVIVVKDNQSSVFSSLSAGLQYAYLKKIGKGTLRAGIQLGMISLSAAGENIILPTDSLGNTDADDEAIPTSKVESKAFDANFGLYYQTDTWYIGAAMTHILEPTFNGEHFSTFINRGYNFIGGYNIRVRETLLEVRPSVFVQTNFNTYVADLTAKAVYAKKYSAGLSWRLDNSRAGNAVILLLGATFGMVEGGYAYDIPLSPIRKGTLGSHELFLKYRMQLNKPKTGKSKHKSVRIL